MQGLTKQNFREYWFFLFWSFVTVTSFPFILGMWLVGEETVAPISFALFM